MANILPEHLNARQLATLHAAGDRPRQAGETFPAWSIRVGLPLRVSRMKVLVAEAAVGDPQAQRALASKRKLTAEQSSALRTQAGQYEIIRDNMATMFLIYSGEA